jgi:hypothetical protein
LYKAKIKNYVKMVPMKSLLELYNRSKSQDMIAILPGVLSSLFLLAYILNGMWPEINQSYNESVDFAANSLLIIDAKEWSLLVGHYSRVGFNHPSPVMLYLFAFSETLFFDLIKVVKSPFSAHLLFVAIFNWVCISGTFYFVQRQLKNFPISIFFTTLYLVAVNYFERGAIAGPWFPHIYIFIYGGLLVFMASFVNGDRNAFIPLFVAAFFLVGTNVSMAPQILIIFLAVLIWMVWNKTGRAVLRSCINFWYLMFILILILIFFGPLVYVVIVDGYSNSLIHSYVAYSGGKVPNTIYDSALYLTSYWGGVFPCILAICAIAISIRGAGSFIRDFFLVCIIATLSFLVYAKFGIDDLQHRYLGMYYYSLVAMTFSFLVILSLKNIFFQIDKKIEKIFSYLIAFFMVLFWLAQPRPIPGNVSLYQSPDGVHLFNVLKEIGTDKMIFIDIDQTEDPAYVWSNVLGFLIHAKRNGMENFCIRKNWHISYTVNYKCTSKKSPDEIISISKLTRPNPIGSYVAGSILVETITDQ